MNTDFTDLGKGDKGDEEEIGRWIVAPKGPGKNLNKKQSESCIELSDTISFTLFFVQIFPGAAFGGRNDPGCAFARNNRCASVFICDFFPQRLCDLAVVLLLVVELLV